MPGNLRDRLRRIRGLQQGCGEIKAPIKPRPPVPVLPGWESAGYLTLRRVINSDESIMLPPLMPPRVDWIMPGIRATTTYTDLLFFDLETTGLSGGAGTLAFLAAFGRLLAAEAVAAEAVAAEAGESGVFKLHVTQYLLLDYPGESDFIEAILSEFKNDTTVVSYNGKCFDSQILKTRCFMNAVKPPEYAHADLLHPSRRFWKRLLPDCSQGTIETLILGIDRTGDTPGAQAPDIWFSFLKNGETEPLWGICEHNCRDISGLAAIFSALARIADDPLRAARSIKYDLESFAPRYGLLLRGMGNYDESREWLLMAADNFHAPRALRALAIDSEHRLKNPVEALSFTERALSLMEADSSLREDFERRLRRLRKKLYHE